jgi:hypothetical protein
VKIITRLYIIDHILFPDLIFKENF